MFRSKFNSSININPSGEIENQPEKVLTNQLEITLEILKCKYFSLTMKRG